MSSAGLGMIIEILVALLLVMTIAYCVVLNGRLKTLRADEHILKATIGELLAATEVAERAIIGLKATTREAETSLGQKLRDAQTLRNELQSLTGGAAPARTIQPPLETRAMQQPQPVRVAPQPTAMQPPAQHVPVLSAPSPQQLASAMRGLDQALNAPQPAPQQVTSAQAGANAQDFRVFTRSSFSSRG